jgi:hypothetical protein
MKRPTPTELDTLEWSLGHSLILVPENTRDRKRLVRMEADGLVRRLEGGAYWPTERGGVALIAGRLTKTQVLALLGMHQTSANMIARLRKAGIVNPDSTAGRLCLTVLGADVWAMLSEWEAAEEYRRLKTRAEDETEVGAAGPVV